MSATGWVVMGAPVAWGVGCGVAANVACKRRCRDKASVRPQDRSGGNGGSGNEVRKMKLLKYSFRKASGWCCPFESGR